MWSVHRKECPPPSVHKQTKKHSERLHFCCCRLPHWPISSHVCVFRPQQARTRVGIFIHPSRAYPQWLETSTTNSGSGGNRYTSSNLHASQWEITPTCLLASCHPASTFSPHPRWPFISLICSTPPPRGRPASSPSTQSSLYHLSYVDHNIPSPLHEAGQLQYAVETRIRRTGTRTGMRTGWKTSKRGRQTTEGVFEGGD